MDLEEIDDFWGLGFLVGGGRGLCRDRWRGITSAERLGQARLLGHIELELHAHLPDQGFARGGVHGPECLGLRQQLSVVRADLRSAGKASVGAAAAAELMPAPQPPAGTTSATASRSVRRCLTRLWSPSRQLSRAALIRDEVADEER